MALYTLEEFASYVQSDVDTATALLLRDLATGAIGAATGLVVDDTNSELKRIALQAASRAYRNPGGLRQETIGSESYTYAAETVANEVALTPQEKREARRAVGIGGAFTVELVPPLSVDLADPLWWTL